jgi:photosystem II stability/assembly factor-like uncharacterized protein
VFHSADRGQTWTVAETPIIHGAASQGIFSLAFWTAKDGVAIGGDYKDPKKGESVAAVTHDGGKTWKLTPKQPAGYRSAVAAGTAHALIAVGTTGVDVSLDGGNNWDPMFTEDLNAVSFTGDKGRAVGPAGKIVAIRLNVR